MLSEFDRITTTSEGDIKYTLSTDMQLTNSTIFFLSIKFSGSYEKGCGATFNIVDTNGESMCHIDFRIYIKNQYRKIVQDSKLNGEWGWVTGKDIITDLPDLSKVSEIFVVVTPTVYEVSINNVVLEPQLPVDMSRFDMFRGLTVRMYETCFTVDLEKSYMNNGGTYVNKNLEGGGDWGILAFGVAF